MPEAALCLGVVVDCVFVGKVVGGVAVLKSTLAGLCLLSFATGDALLVVGAIVGGLLVLPSAALSSVGSQ